MKLRDPSLAYPARPLAVLALLLGLAWPQWGAAQSAGGPNWSQLNPSQKSALAPLQNDWDQLDASRKQKWLEVASRFGSMSPQRQERVRERMNEWARLSPDQRNEARLNFQQSKQVAPQDRQARWEAYQQLPPEERAALAKRAQPTYQPPSKPSPVQSLRNAPVDAQTPKSNIVAPTRGVVPPPKPVAPSVVQGNPGATTKLATSSPKPPPHQEPGQPKIAATPKQVDRATLLPRTGPQAAEARNGRAGASSPPPNQGRPAAPGK